MKLPHIINRQHSLLAIFLFALIFLCGCVPSFMATKLLKTALQPTNTSKDTTVAWKNEIKEYDSMASAGRELGVNVSKICECCKGRRLSAYGYKWEYK